MTQDQFISQLVANNKGEQDAMAGYYLLLSEARRNGLPKELIEDIEEIISDEMNHSKKLTRWATELSGIKPSTSSHG